MKRTLMIVIALLLTGSQAGWANPGLPYQISEYSTQPPWIELFFLMDTDLSNMVVHTMSGDAVIDSGVVGVQDAYLVLDQTNTSGFALNPEGDSIVISGLYFSLGYGNQSHFAVAPLPGESATSLIGDGFYYCFNRYPNPGGPDDHAFMLWGNSEVVLNEVNAHGTWNRCCNFVELYNRIEHVWNISGYHVICNARITIPQGTILKPYEFYLIDESQFPPGFGPRYEGDIVYLLNENGDLVDQVGWSTDHGENVSFMRFPDGDLQYQNWQDYAGYNDSTSYTFENGFPSRRAFNRHESPGLKIIGTAADTSYGHALVRWTDPIWQTDFDASILRKSEVAFPGTPYDGDLIYEGQAQEFVDGNVTPGQRTYYTVFARTTCGEYSVPDSESQASVYLSPEGVGESQLPEKSGYLKAYPNPFNAKTLLNYQIATAGPVKISIYDLTGQKIAAIMEANQDAGQHSTLWDASGYPSGVYFARLETGGGARSLKMVLVK
jgi:hypothetical protein